MTTRKSRGGFTLVELLVVAVVGSLVVLAAHKVMAGSVRAYTVVGARVQTQQAVRAGADVLFGELREISPSGGDIISMTPDSLVIRSMRSFGVACEVTVSGTPTLKVKRLGYSLQPGDSVFFFADNSTHVSSDDVWLRGQVGTVDNTATCPSGDEAMLVTLPGLAPVMALDTVRVGAPVRSYESYWYGLVELNGDGYLARRQVGASGPPEPLVGPLKSRAGLGLRFAYLDAMGAPTNFRNRVAQVRVTLRAASNVVTSTGTLVADSMVTSIYPRN